MVPGVSAETQREAKNPVVVATLVPALEVRRRREFPWYALDTREHCETVIK